MGGIAAITIFAVRVDVGQVPLGSNLFLNLLQVNEYAYFSAAFGLYFFRLNRTPPNSLEIAESGLIFGFTDGRNVEITWTRAQGETVVVDQSGPVSSESPGKIWLFSTPGSQALRCFTFMRPTVPQTCLTRDAMDAVLGGAVRAGLNVTRYGTRYVMDPVNRMEFRTKF